MRPALVGDVEALQRFTREAENASQLSHPNIAAIFDFGETADGIVYLAMEYVDGESLAAKLDRESALHPDIAADILGQAADALQAAHDLNMLHRDIKPDNIMLGLRSDGTFMVKLVDFGIARTMDSSNTRVTRTGFAIGTPQYMSPEQLAGDTLDPRSDQYALALVAFYALTGKQAFPAESSKESLILRLTSRPQSLQDARQDVVWPQPLQEIFDRALAPDAAERFETVSDFAHALAGAISEMTPTQTAELYRRALDTRVANVAARTPHSSAEGLRTSSASVSAIRTNTLASSSEPSSAGAAAPITSGVTEERVRLTSTGNSRAGMLAGGAVLVAGALWLAFGRGATGSAEAASRTSADSALADSALADSALADSALADSAARIAVGASPTVPNAPSSPSGTAPAGSAPVAAPAAATATATAPGAPAASVAAKSAAAKADSVKRAQRDSAKLAEQRIKKERADSVARVASVRARYPEAAARAVIARGIDGKARIVRNGDVRAVIMPTPVFVWRAEQGDAWRNGKTSASGEPYPMVDPIEAWSPWKSVVSSRRAMYVLEVTPEKAPWPSFAPDKVFEIRRGDVESVELLRDGVAVTLEQSSRIPALANVPAHVAAGKPVPNEIVALVAPAAFMPREDGSLPKIEVVVRDAARGSAVTRIALSDGLVRRLYDDFAPWRDAIARPQ
ncbi:serine/threonine-protein kinase [Gemmatimonas sp.]|uniref:serine/threonine-protein kinase n=1 Tax=Gemmatimonas sp. TaxID=1962908 RepID=UPI003DA5B42A